MFTLSVGAIFRNEAHILKEWIEHYLFHGVQHFFLINDQSTDNFAEILDPYIQKQQVTLNSPIWSRYSGRQFQMYNAFILPHLKTTEWLLMVDLDEFMWSPCSINLYDVLKTINNVGQIQVEHTLFGSSGHIEQPASVVNNFLRRSHDSPTANPGLRKYFVNSAFEFSDLTIHHAIFKDRTHEKNNFILLNKPHFVLNHYNCQSLNFWKNVKCTRGDADEYKIRDMELFKVLDLNDVEDTRLRDQNAAIIREPIYYVFIISIKESSIRRPHVIALKNKLIAKGIRTEIIDAFYWKTCDVIKTLSMYGLTYTAENNHVSCSAVGCFLSHYIIWKRIAVSDPTYRYIILEDDMDIESDFSLSDLTRALPSEYDIVYLWKHPAQADQQSSHQVPGKDYCTHYFQWGTTAYMITPSAAQYCLDTIKTQDDPVDHLLNKHVVNKLRSFIMNKDYFWTRPFKSIILGDDPVYTSERVDMIALCLLCRTPNPIWLEFLNTFNKYDIYIMVDDNNYNIKQLGQLYPNIHILQISNELCKQLGYNDSNTAVYPAYVTIAWDKAIYYFSEIETTYDYVWLIEEDVFFYNQQAVINIDQKYPTSDLLMAPVTDRAWDATQPWDWHWCNVPFDDTLVKYENLLRGMVCASRMSKRMMEYCSNYAKKNKQRKLMYIETFFSSLARQNNLQLDTPSELSTIQWNTNWLDQSLSNDNLYHPMKDINIHKNLRASVP